MNTPYNTNDTENPIQHSECNIVMTEKKYSFLKTESKVIITGVLSLITLSGCVAIIILYPNTCSVGNGAYTVIGSIMGAWGSSLLSRTQK